MNTNKNLAKVLAPKEAITYAPNSIVSQQIIKSSSGNITLFAFDKDEQLSEHTAPFNALVQMLDGNAEIYISGAPHHLNVGEIIILPANIPHAAYAKAQFIMLLTM